jgi:hypothetical protein
MISIFKLLPLVQPANLVRKWIPIYRDRQASALPAFVPMKFETAVVTLARHDVARIDIACAQRTVTVNWPICDRDGCALMPCRRATLAMDTPWLGHSWTTWVLKGLG